MSWFPTTDFENEVVSMQPDHDFIFGRLNDPDDEQIHYPRPESHLRFVEEKKKQRKEQIERNSSSNNRKLDIISKVQRIAGTKPLGVQPTLDDWDDDMNVERETIAMMRNLGLQPNIEEALDEKCTIATLPLSEEMLVMHNGSKRLPIFYNDKFFKLKPRVSLELKTLEETDTISDPNQSLTSQSTADDAVNDFSASASVSISSGDTYDKLNTTDNFETAEENSMHGRRGMDGGEEDQSFNTASSNDYVSTRSWYRNKKNRKSSFLNNSSSTGSHTSNASSADENWRQQSSNASSAADNNWRQQSPKKQPERFYTARELYFKNRKN